MEKKYKIAHVLFEANKKKSIYFCDDDSIETGDLVIAEDDNNSAAVERIEELKESELPCPINKIKNIVGKAQVSDNNDIKLDEKLVAKPINTSFFNDIRIEAEVAKEFSYADYHTDCLCKVNDNTFFSKYSLIQNLLLMNHTNKAYDYLTIKFKFSNYAFSMEDIRVKSIEANNDLALRIPFLKVNKQALDSLTDTETASLKLEICDEANNLLHEQEYVFNVLPISQPSVGARYDFRLYAKYVTPLEPKVKQLTLNAVKYNKNKSIVAYQNGDNYKKILGEIEAIYLALHNYGIVYQNPPAGGFYKYSEDGSLLCSQRLRMPREVLNDKKGTCLDLSILFCACLLEVDYHPLLIFINGHAFVGVFLNEGLKYNNGVETSPAKVYNHSSDGLNEIVLIDSVCFTSENEFTFEAAVRSAKNQLRGYNDYFAAVDVATCHTMVFSPIPIKGHDEKLELLMKPKELENSSLDSIISKHYVDVKVKEEKDRFTFWEKRLLDLTESNPLVNYRMRPTNTVKLISNTNIAELIKPKDKAKLVLYEAKNNSEGLDLINAILKNDVKLSEINYIVGEANNDDIYAFGLEKTLKTLKKKSDSAMDETGSPTLYLCMGNLLYERKVKGELGLAPFMVLPIKITKDKMGNTWTMSYDYDDLMLNQTFFEYYKSEHPDDDFSSIYHIDQNYSYMDYVATFKKHSTSNIQLDEAAFYIANLTFSHYIMWMDIRKRKEELKKNKVVESILANKNVLEQEPFDENIAIDKLEKYEDFAAPLPYDSTQLKAILDCGRGNSFILDGPPGTGKSQTIVNMIVNAFYHGKTVLFVAEKKAALDVVYDRLSKIQLGRFCLELHSNKANKGDFFSKLKSSMELGPTKNPEEFKNKCLELEQKRKDLAHIINKMHEHKYVMSLYDAIVTKESLNFLEQRIDLDRSFLINLDDKTKNTIDSLIEKFIISTEEINDYQKNPLRYLDADDINYNEANEIVALFAETNKQLDKLLISIQKLVEATKLNIDISADSINSLIKTIGLALDSKIYIDKVNNYLANEDDSNANYLFERTPQLLKIRNEYSRVFDFDKIKTIDADKEIKKLEEAKGFFNKIKIKKQALELLNSASLPNNKFKKNKLINYFKVIDELNTLDLFIINRVDEINKMLDLDFYENLTKVDEIKNNYYSTREFAKHFKELFKYKNKATLIKFYKGLYDNEYPEVKYCYDNAVKDLKQYEKYEDNLSRFKINYKDLIKSKKALENYKRLLDYASDINNFNDLIDVAATNKIGNLLKENNLGEFLSEINNNEFDIADFLDMFNLVLADDYIRLYFEDPEINYFSPSVYEDDVKKYKELIDEYSNLIIEEVSAKLTLNLNHNNIKYANSSPIGRLKKAISSNGRGVTIRDTLLTYDEIIKAYFPCFLMSPLSAAQYLSVEENKSKFDLVIFDEASQIPTHEAVGPIARGKALIVAGDPEQMPPSAYFTAGLELEGEDVEYEDAESLLDECLAIELPRHRLSYHYRSKHESLISFSNHNFYNDSLYTFPSVNTKNSMIEFRYVELKENKKNTNITPAEIRAIIDTFKEIYSNPKTKNKSVGIIVFNMKQQDAVYESINNYLASDKLLAASVANAEEQTREPWFVKSLENVQGDERDIIILSIGFRKSATGNPVINGPLVRENGQRRLNVAVSRSKEKMIVISTIKYNDFTYEIKASRGKELLKEFLKYVENNSFKTSGGIDEKDQSIIYYIKEALEERGLNVISNVGNSEFKVDLAIKNKEGNEYCLGILVDSKKPSANISLRDKLYVQAKVLNSLKWKIINVYAVSYYKDPKGTIDQIIKSIDMPYVKQKTYISPNIEKKEIEEFKYKVIPYKKVGKLFNISYDNNTGFDSNTIRFIAAIIDTESPVSFETIKNRIRECSNINSMSSKAKQRLSIILRSFNKVTVDQNQVFYWKSSELVGYLDTFRKAADRDLNDIAKEELACAMKQILEVQKELTKEDLFKCTLQAFEYGSNVLSTKNLERLEYVYNWAKNKNLI